MSLDILNPSATELKWDTKDFKVLDSGKDIDIVVLVPSAPLLGEPIPNPPPYSAGAPLGGDCEFLGYPFG